MIWFAIFKLGKYLNNNIENELKERVTELEKALFHICEIFHNKITRDLIPSDTADDVFIQARLLTRYMQKDIFKPSNYRKEDKEKLLKMLKNEIPKDISLKLLKE